mmetsp:Transcript_45650/g.79428  ORF Transcript_45650/g.79428 Transcript_45650/m.79428 type:complete len:352 (-) Transcript_45650:232-1287(-)
MMRLPLLLSFVLAGLVQAGSVEDFLDDETTLLQVRQRTKHMKVHRTKVQRTKMVGGLGAPPAAAKYNSDEDLGDDAVWPAPDDPENNVTEEDRNAIRNLKEGLATNDLHKTNKSVPHLAMIDTNFMVQEGGYDLIFEVINTYQADEYATVQQNAWRGLSDQCATEKGSYIIANRGGPNKGVEFMVEQLLIHPFDYGRLEDQLTVQYEIMTDLDSLIVTDNNNTRGPAAVRAGLVPAVMRSLMGEPELIATQATACRVMTHLFMRNPQYASLFRDAGAPLYVQKAMERYKDGDDTPYHFGFTMGSFYNVTSDCSVPFGMFSLDYARQEIIDSWADFKPWFKLDFDGNGYWSN